MIGSAALGEQIELSNIESQSDLSLSKKSKSKILLAFPRLSE